MNYALKYSLEWGKNHEKPIYGRMKSKFKFLSDEKIAELESLSKEVKKECWKVIDEQFKMGCNEQKKFSENLMKRISEKYIWIDKDNLSSLNGQFCYYAWKEGVIK